MTKLLLCALADILTGILLCWFLRDYYNGDMHVVWRASVPWVITRIIKWSILGCAWVMLLCIIGETYVLQLRFRERIKDLRD